MRVIVRQDYATCAEWAANHIVWRINEFSPTEDRPFVLGLPTGSSPLGVYRELIRLHKAGKISFKNVVTFNMDEYKGLDRDHPQSYRRFMMDNFFSHIDISMDNVNFLDGMAKDPAVECKRYEDKIASYGKIHLFFGGVGADGHIAFNDPSVANFNDPLKVKIVQLEDSCRKQQVNDGCFPDIDSVPQKAVTVTMPVFMKCRYILLMVPGNTKADAVKNTLFNAVSENCPASVLRNHQNAFLFLDKNSAKYINK